MQTNRDRTELPVPPEVAKLMDRGITSRMHDSVVGLLAGTCLLGTVLTSMAGTNGDFAQSIATDTGNDGWEFFFQLDGYAPWLEIETPTGTEIDFGLDDIIDSLQMIAEFSVGVRKGKWGLQTGVIYADLAGNPSGSIVNKVELEEWYVTPAITYRAYEGQKGFLDLVFGLRYTWVDFSLEGARPISGAFFKEEGSGDSWDGFVGVSGDYRINEKWHVPYSAVVGAGDSDFITETWAGFGYRLNPCSDIGLLFRVIYYDFGDSAPLDTELVYGPHLYYRYTF